MRANSDDNLVNGNRKLRRRWFGERTQRLVRADFELVNDTFLNVNRNMCIIARIIGSPQTEDGNVLERTASLKRHFSHKRIVTV